MRNNAIDKSHFWLKTTSLEPGVEFIERQHFHTDLTQTMDTYSGFWMLYMYEHVPPGMYIKVGNTIVEITSHTALYVPPYQPVEWVFPAGWVEWNAYCVHHTPENFLPVVPALFTWDPLQYVGSYRDLMEVMKAASASMMHLEYSIRHSQVKILLNFLRTHFHENLKMADIYTDLKIKSPLINGAFKKALGLAPVQYRNSLRVFEALRRISQGEAPTDVCYAVGFNDYSRFYRQFYSVLDNAPTDFIRQDRALRRVA